MTPTDGFLIVMILMAVCAAFSTGHYLSVQRLVRHARKQREADETATSRNMLLTQTREQCDAAAEKQEVFDEGLQQRQALALEFEMTPKTPPDSCPKCGHTSSLGWGSVWRGPYYEKTGWGGRLRWRCNRCDFAITTRTVDSGGVAGPRSEPAEFTVGDTIKVRMPERYRQADRDDPPEDELSADEAIGRINPPIVCGGGHR